MENPIVSFYFYVEVQGAVIARPGLLMVVAPKF